MATSGLINNALTANMDPNAPVSSTNASASSIGAAVDPNAQPSGSNISAAPDTGGLSAAHYTNQLNAAATPASVNPPSTSSATGVPSSVPTSASTYSPSQLGTPTQLNVAPQQTVQGQLANINNPNSAIIQAARNGAKQQANASGLINSSMAITAGDTAAYNAALPIAEQDATIYNNDAATNAAAANTFATANQNAQNTAAATNAGAANTLTGQQLSNQTSLTNSQVAANTSLANTATQTASAQTIAQMNNTNTSNIQASANVAQAGAQYQTALTNIANVNTDAQGKYNLEVAAYNAYVQTVQSLTKSAAVPDVSNLLQFNQINPTTGAATTAQGTATPVAQVPPTAAAPLSTWDPNNTLYGGSNH